MPATRRSKATPQQLANLAKGPAHGGQKPIKVHRRTLRPINMLREISQGRLDPHELTPKQRRACLVVMANGTQTSAQLAEVFGVSAPTIRRDVQRIRAEIGREVHEWSMEEVVGDLVHTSEKCATMAMQQEDPGLVWTIKRDMAKLLREWGVIGKGGQANSLTVTVEHIGESYERMKGVLAFTMDPELTGEVVPDGAPRIVDAKVLPQRG